MLQKSLLLALSAVPLSTLQGCVATTVASTAVGVAATGVKTGVKVAGAVVGVAATTAGRAVESRK